MDVDDFRNPVSFGNRVSEALTHRQRLTVGLLGLYEVFQLLFPLRHYLYPGPVSWTEEVHYLAWQMKLRAKEGLAAACRRVFAGSAGSASW